jgi:hypothetical protein
MNNAINLHAATLARLDGYLAALQYSAGHPWRAEIAASLALPPEVESTGITVTLPYSSVHIPMRDAEDHAIMRAKQLAASLRQMPVGAYFEPTVLLARRLADELVVAVRAGSGGALLASQLGDLMTSLDDGGNPCDTLWLCQQLCAEILETIEGIAEQDTAVSTPTSFIDPAVRNESNLLAAYRKSDQRGQESIFDYAVSMSEDWPAARVSGVAP